MQWAFGGKKAETDDRSFDEILNEYDRFFHVKTKETDVQSSLMRGEDIH